MRQQDAIESDLHRVIAEDALRMISNRFEERFRASFPAFPRWFALESIVLAQEGFGDMPYDLEGQHFPRDEIHTLGAVGPVRRLCSTGETILGQRTTTVEQATVIRDALSSKSAHCVFHAGKVRLLVLQHSLFRLQRCPEFLVGEVAPNECDWEQPRVAHGMHPADLTHVSRHVSCIAPCLDTRVGNHRHDVIKFPSPKRASYLQASATVEASASKFPFAATVRWHVPRWRLCSTATARRFCMLRSTATVLCCYHATFFCSFCRNSSLARAAMQALQHCYRPILLQALQHCYRALLLPRDYYFLRRARMKSLHRRRFSSALARDSNLAEGFFVALMAALRFVRSAIAWSVAVFFIQRVNKRRSKQTAAGIPPAP